MRLSKLSGGLFLISMLHLFLLSRLQFVDWPEMVAWPALLLKGWFPYEDIAIAHTPLLIYLLTAFYAVFGVGSLQVKLFAWGVIIISDVLVYFIAAKLHGRKVALVSLAFFILLQISYQGNSLWFETALLSVLLLVYFLLKRKKYAALGASFAAAILIKQTAIWLLPLVFIYLLLNKKKLSFQSLTPFLSGFFAVIMLFLLVLSISGIFDDFWYWAVQFGIGYLPGAEGQVLLPTIKQFAFYSSPFILLLFVALKSKNTKIFELVVWSGVAALGIFPRWELFHFQPALGFLAIAAGLLYKRKNLIALTVFLLILLVIFYRGFIPASGYRFYTPEIAQLSRYISSVTHENETIYVVNSWDSIYAYSNRLPSPRPLVPYLPWYFADHSELVSQNLSNTPPELIVVKTFDEEGLGSFKSEAVLNFIEEKYHFVRTISGHEIYLRNIK